MVFSQLLLFFFNAHSKKLNEPNFFFCKKKKKQQKMPSTVKMSTKNIDNDNFLFIMRSNQAIHLLFCIKKLITQTQPYTLATPVGGKKKRIQKMATLASPKKRTTYDSIVDTDLLVLEPSSKKIKAQISMLEEGKTNEKRENEKKEEDNNDSWTKDPNKKQSDFRNYINSRRQEKVEKFYKEQHSKMTYEVITCCKMGASRKGLLKKQKQNSWDMLRYMDQVMDDSDPDTNLTQIEHAVQTAEAARMVHPEPEYDWFHLTGLIHDLGKILTVVDESKGLKGEEQWCVAGDTFPVGCQFSETNIFYEYFKDNPDFQNKKYNTLYGIYQPKCGLDQVIMSWGHDEYLYQVILFFFYRCYIFYEKKKRNCLI
ncbi:inositol oxygenase [Reticulomyxa filosa]|uniref:Inositol oxygenase n=1 Tax=Reticulomyxa filosa TaxID=46433 RepID=X6MAT3_RETFI|nr:inositol oxygenase [Reticulomyxa filosa]|eukprot:ETO10954.1 inositol oxygenase [Reticulomyxa filosa]